MVQSQIFMVMGLVSQLSLVNHSDSVPFLVVHTLFSQMDFSEEDSGRLVRQVASPFDPSQILLVGGIFLVPCSLLVTVATAKSLQSCPTLCDPIDGSHQAPPSLGFSRQEHWSG